jgi:hypothetical protein
VEQLTWRPAQPSHGGCRGLELDLHQGDGGKSWSVAHLGGYSRKPERQLSVYLDQLRCWSETNPGHDPITVHLDVKSAGDVRSGADALDSYLDRHLGVGRLFTPRNILGATGTDLVAEASRGWPPLGELSGRFLLCLSGKDSWKRGYARLDLRSRLCFSDLDVPPDTTRGPNPRTGPRVFLNLRYDLATHLKPALRWIREHRAFVSRVYKINSRTAWSHVLPPGANIIATDAVSGRPWAAVGREPFVTTLEFLST